MKASRLAAGSLALAVLAIAPARGRPPLPALDDKPTPMVDAWGPSAPLTALAFADEKTLYGAGLDKVVRVWALGDGRWTLRATYRVPVGPGNAGAVNAVALSPDGKWVAMAGRAPMRGEAGFREGGVVVEAAALSPEQNLDSGLIYVASTANPAGGKVLRGHHGEVRALAFAPAAADKPPLLVSAATERVGGRRFGGLRLWDVAAGKELANRDDLQATDTRPGLAVWRTGPGATAVRVAVAWPEAKNAKTGSLRLWDPAPGADPLQKWGGDAGTTTAVLVGSDPRAAVLTGGSNHAGNWDGRLRVWRFSPDRDTEALVETAAEFPREGDVWYRPVALVPVQVAGGRARLAAVVLQPFPDAEFRLALVDLSDRRVVAAVTLSESDRGRLPVLAATGRYVAVAASRDHSVRLYDVDELLSGKKAAATVPPGRGLAARRVAFVDKGRGLWLDTDGGLVFDVDGRRLRADDGGKLARDEPDLAGWEVEVIDDRRAVSVRHGDEAMPTVRPPEPGQVVTRAALRPPAGGRPGVLAVACTEPDAERSFIMLCDPADGKPYRLLVGHLQEVRDLAFSASRQLLASVADDQAVCVWSLADLDKAVGFVPGLRVSDGKGGKAEVRRVEPGSPAARLLAEGNVLERVGGPAGVAVKGAADFLLAVSARRPGDKLEVAVADKKDPVRLPVGRGVDERMPLFTLFLARTGGLPEWVGWSPAGPYDFSSPAAEGHLGWHTNTGDPAAPVAFAASGAYREQYRREGILRYLAEEADLGRALKKWDEAHPAVPPRPSLSPLRPDGAAPAGRDREYLVRQPVRALHVAINEDFPLNDRHFLRWRLTRAGDKGTEAAVWSGVAARDGREWEADLSGADWRRGEYRLRLSLHARTDGPDPDGPELATEAVPFRFQPPRPSVALLGAEDGKPVSTTERAPLTFDKVRMELSVALTAPPGQEVELRFVQSCNGEPLPAERVPAACNLKGTNTSLQTFTLQKGLNRLAVRAVNRGALAGHEEEESAAAEVWVNYKAPDELPPRFTDVRLDPAPAVRRLQDGELWVVDRPMAQLTGRVKADGVLEQAEWSVDGGQPTPAELAEDKHGAKFAPNLELKAGVETVVRLYAKSRDSNGRAESYRVVFHPLLPAVAFGPTDGPDVLTEEVALGGTFRAATADPFGLRLRVSAEGKEKFFDAQRDTKAGTWKAGVTLFPGPNTVEALVSNAWRGEKAADGALRLRYLRPPKITASPPRVEVIGKNKASVELTVEGPADRPLRAFFADSQPVDFTVKADKPAARAGWREWTVELPEVFVTDGSRKLERVAVWAVNDEGKSPKVLIPVIHKEAREPRPPRARFVGVAVEDRVHRPEYAPAFRVVSELPLDHVKILRGDEVLFRADGAKAVREGPLFVLEGRAELKMNEGTNRLELLAVNADGRSAPEGLVVSYVTPAALITVDRVELRRAEDLALEASFTPVCDPDCGVRFPDALPRSLVFLVGRVRWSDPEDMALDEGTLKVVAKVGDCRQLPVELGARGAGGDPSARAFEVPLVLIRPENRVTLEVPSVGRQEASRSEFTLSCSAPTREQRLHVLVVGVDVEDADRLKRQVLDALAVDAGGRPPRVPGAFSKNPPFSQCVLYAVLTGEVERGNVVGELLEINNAIKHLKKSSGWLNDVVLIYYQGAAASDVQHNLWLMTSHNTRWPKDPPEETAINYRALPKVPGTELLVLSVTGKPEPVPGIQYAKPAPPPPGAVDPALLAKFGEAVRKKGNLGDAVKYIAASFAGQAGTFAAALDDYQADRRFHEPGSP
jgi:WD40 repeat protein